MCELDARIESAIRTVKDDAYAEGLRAGRAGKRLNLVGVSPKMFKMEFARGWVAGSTEYAARLLKDKGEGTHSAFLRASARYLGKSESLKRLGIEWPPKDE